VSDGNTVGEDAGVTQANPRSEAQKAVICDLASIAARAESPERRPGKPPFVVTQPGFIVGTITAFIVFCPVALASMENLNPVTFFVVRPYVPVGTQGVLAAFGAWLCLSVIVGIGTACVLERQWRWSIALPLLLLIVCIIIYAPASNAAATKGCAEDHRNHVQVRC
jgi:hypothetical protein